MAQCPNCMELNGNKNNPYGLCNECTKGFDADLFGNERLNSIKNNLDNGAISKEEYDAEVKATFQFMSNIHTYGYEKAVEIENRQFSIDSDTKN